MTVSLYNSDTMVKLPVKFSGYVGEDDHDLDMEFILPIGIYNLSSHSLNFLLLFAVYVYNRPLSMKPDIFSVNWVTKY